MRRIPTRGFDDYINYNGEVFIITYDEDGNTGDFQWDGTSCLQGSVQGFVYKSFKTKSKWFNPDWWYKKTSWGKDFPKRVYFKEHKLESDALESTYNDFPPGRQRTSLVKAAFNAWEKESTEIADLYGRPVENILKAILREVKNKTNIPFELAFDDLDYRKHWGEAYVPLKYKDKKYLLTWQNCD